LCGGWVEQLPQPDARAVGEELALGDDLKDAGGGPPLLREEGSQFPEE
jgi:hypothetical protein